LPDSGPGFESLFLTAFGLTAEVLNLGCGLDTAREEVFFAIRSVEAIVTLRSVIERIARPFVME
jgi:hypothetical protein